MTDLDPAVLLAVYDEKLRARIPRGATVEHDGPVIRFVHEGSRGFVTYRDLDGVTGPDLDALIARQRDFFAARGESVEWKTCGHDRPLDLPERLHAAGFEPEPLEVILAGLVAPLAATDFAPPAGVRLREATTTEDIHRIVPLSDAVWGGDQAWLADRLSAEVAADPGQLSVVLAETPEQVVCAGWIRYEEGTGFATIWGGSTLPEWRRKGIYRALLTYRARLAAERGYEYLQVDTSEDSRPILRRLGFVELTTTTPYVWRMAV